MSITLLPGIRITSEICLFIATLADKDNRSSHALLSDSLSYNPETFIEGQRVPAFLMARGGTYSAHACLVSKSHNQNANIK